MTTAGKGVLWMSVLIFWTLTTLQASEKNFIIILVDDQGWNGTSALMDTAVSGSKSDLYETPHFENLCTIGMRFSQAYTPAATCSPSRAAILTGQMPASIGLTGNAGRTKNTADILLAPDDSAGLPFHDTTIAEYLNSLSSADYLTGYYGKWHLENLGPTEHGFDMGDSLTTNAEGNDAANMPGDPKKTFSITENGLAFIDTAQARAKPFLLVMSYYAVHYHWQFLTASGTYFAGKSLGSTHTNRDYAAMTMDLDSAMGLVTDYYFNNGLDSNTYIIYISDNGSALGDSNDISPPIPLRGEKSTLYEGGLRVPMVMIGPGIDSGTVNATAVSGIDIFPTIAEIAVDSTGGIPEVVDGQSLWDNIQSGGTPTDFREDTGLVFHFPRYQINPVIGRYTTPRSSLVTDENFKLVVAYETGDFELYDLNTDLSESTDLSGTSASFTWNLAIELRDRLKAMGAAMPTLNPADTTWTGSGTDLDNDSLEDAWEFRELLTVKYTGKDDPDGDGFTNEEEETYGFDPMQVEVGLLNLEEDSIPNIQTEKEKAGRFESSVKHYPNPFGNHLFIHVKRELEYTVTVKLFDLNGILRFETELDAIGKYTVGRALPIGPYILRYNINDNLITDLVLKL